jgi:hypothetical protein
MPKFTSETARAAGKKSKRGKSKKTIAKQERLENLFEANGGFEEIFNDIAQIEDPSQRATARMKMLEYFTPKLKSVDMSTTIQDEREELTPEEIEQRLKEMQEELKQFDDD